MTLPFTTRVRKVVAQPRDIISITPLSTEYVHEVLTTPDEHLRFADLNLLLMEPFPSFLYYIPPALEYCDQMKDEYEQVAENIVRCLAMWTTEVRTSGFYNEIVSLLKKAFTQWTTKFAGQRVLREAPPYIVLLDAAVSHSNSRDDFLEALIEHDIAFNDGTAFSFIFHDWASDQLNSARSAHLLDLMFQCVYGNHNRGFCPHLCASALVRSCVRNRALHRLHWKSARSLVRAQCPTEYAEAIEIMFGL
jgi:hypothetical protein